MSNLLSEAELNDIAERAADRAIKKVYEQLAPKEDAKPK